VDRTFPFVVPWRIRDPFFVLLGAYLAFIAFFVVWGIVLGIQAAKTLYSSSPWLDLFLLMQSFLMLWFTCVFLLKPWAVKFDQFVVPGQGASDARAAVKLFFGCILASLTIVVGIFIILVVVGRLMGHDSARMIQTYQQGMQKESHSLMGTDIGFFRFIPLALVGPPIEELLYRGCLYGALRKRFVPWQANGISSMVPPISPGYLFCAPTVV